MKFRRDFNCCSEATRGLVQEKVGRNDKNFLRLLVNITLIVNSSSYSDEFISSSDMFI